MNIVEMMNDFIVRRDTSVFNFAKPYSDSKELMVICIELLAWLKLEHKRKMWRDAGRFCKYKSKTIPEGASWFDLLADLIQNENSFSSVFVLKDREVSLNETLDETQKELLRKHADALYNPEIND